MNFNNTIIRNAYSKYFFKNSSGKINYKFFQKNKNNSL